MNEKAYITVKATPQHDSMLRKLLRETPIQGRLCVAMESEPSFFASDHDVIGHDVALVLQNETPVACGSRLLRKVFWQNTERHVAYLAHLRLHPRFQKRGGRALLAGYRMLTNCAKDSPAVATWTAIFSSNTKAQTALVGNRAGLPEYVARGELQSSLMLIKRNMRWPIELNCVKATIADMPAITCFLQKELCHRLLAPCLNDNDLTAGRRWPDLQPEDFILVRKDGEIIAVVAVRDLRQYKQVRVIKIPLLWKLARLPSLMLAACNIYPAIPQQGNVLACAYASFFTVKDDDPITAHILLRAACALASEKGLHFLSVAFHENDPKSHSTANLPSLKTNGILYQVMLSGEHETWPEDIPYIDPANL